MIAGAVVLWALRDLLRTRRLLAARRASEASESPEQGAGDS
ncbi:MAG TPA: hypothetical protein VLA56_02315 [Pseudomonadales bacterium]|nr:hypothetical protein [Pseudomonadales bacterium]